MCYTKQWKFKEHYKIWLFQKDTNAKNNRVRPDIVSGGFETARLDGNTRVENNKFVKLIKWESGSYLKSNI